VFANPDECGKLKDEKSRRCSVSAMTIFESRLASVIYREIETTIPIINGSKVSELLLSFPVSIFTIVRLPTTVQVISTLIFQSMDPDGHEKKED